MNFQGYNEKPGGDKWMIQGKEYGSSDPDRVSPAALSGTACISRQQISRPETVQPEIELSPWRVRLPAPRCRSIRSLPSISLALWGFRNGSAFSGLPGDQVGGECPGLWNHGRDLLDLSAGRGAHPGALVGQVGQEKDPAVEPAGDSRFLACFRGGLCSSR